MAEPGNRKRKIGRKGSKKKMEMSLASDFHLINFKYVPLPIPKARRPPHYTVIFPGGYFDLNKALPDWKDFHQLLFRFGSALQISRVRPHKSEVIFTSFNPCVINDVQWSPLGSYYLLLQSDFAILASFVDGFSDKFLQRCYHPELKLADFSPNEKYLVTYSTQRPKKRIQSELQIFDVLSGKLMMGAYDGVPDVSWPVIRWAGGKDDKYFATFGRNTISVYETDTFNLLGEKPMEVENVVDMCWSPTESTFAFLKGGPAKVTLVEVPGMVELKHMELPPTINTADCKMYWQSNGDYLAVKVDDRRVFILSCIKERDIHMEVLKVNGKIHAFEWEPSGHRFAMVIHGGQQQSMPDVSFYSMETLGKVSKLANLKDKEADSLFWSPIGNHIVLAGLKGDLEFFDVDKLKTVNKGEHPNATVVAWDPTGRYVATACTITPDMEKGFEDGFDWRILSQSGIVMYEDPPILEPRYKTRATSRRSKDPPNEFTIWSSEGKKLYSKQLIQEHRLLQVNWRPFRRGPIDDEVVKNLEQLPEKEKWLEDYTSGEEESEHSTGNSASEEGS